MCLPIAKVKGGKIKVCKIFFELRTIKKAHKLFRKELRE